MSGWSHLKRQAALYALADLDGMAIDWETGKISEPKPDPTRGRPR